MDKIDIVLGGAYGKMGNVITALASKADVIGEIHLIDKTQQNISIDDNIRLIRNSIRDPGTVYVDFTEPAAVMDNVKKMSEAGVDSVVGTTGWYDRINEMVDIAKYNDRRIVWAPNFSIGVNTLFAATEYISKILGKYGFDAGVLELHHTGKKDSPSGTAVNLGNILAENIPGKDKIAFERRNQRTENELDVLGARAGSVTGYHMVVFSPNSEDYERLTLEHNASNRNTFGMGALEGVTWVYNAGKDGMAPGLYSFQKDVLGL